MQIFFILLFSFQVSAASKECSDWFNAWKFSAEDKNCELKCNTAPKNLTGAFCDCKELCRSNHSYSIATLVFYPGLSQIEKELIVKDPKSSLKAFINKKLAEKIADKYFPNGVHNDESDAIRHFIWAGLMTFDLGKELAQLYSDAHEQIPYQPAIEKEMDMHNNKVGIESALKLINEKKATIENLTKEGFSQLESKALVVNEPKYKIPTEYKK